MRRCRVIEASHDMTGSEVYANERALLKILVLNHVFYRRLSLCPVYDYCIYLSYIQKAPVP